VHWKILKDKKAELDSELATLKQQKDEGGGDSKDEAGGDDKDEDDKADKSNDDRLLAVQKSAKALHICEQLPHSYGLSGGYNEEMNTLLDELVEFRQFEPQVEIKIPIFFFKHKLESRCMEFPSELFFNALAPQSLEQNGFGKADDVKNNINVNDNKLIMIDVNNVVEVVDGRWLVAACGVLLIVACSWCGVYRVVVAVACCSPTLYSVPERRTLPMLWRRVRSIW
jgi:hypothetical protein